MSLRPLDMTITVQRSPEINRNQAGEGVRPEIAHQQAADKMQREVQIQEQQVTQTHKSEENNVDKDGRGNNGGSGSGSNRRKRRQTDDKAKTAKPGGLSMYDISV